MSFSLIPKYVSDLTIYTTATQIIAEGSLVLRNPDNNQTMNIVCDITGFEDTAIFVLFRAETGSYSLALIAKAGTKSGTARINENSGYSAKWAGTPLFNPVVDDVSYNCWLTSWGYSTWEPNQNIRVYTGADNSSGGLAATIAAINDWKAYVEKYPITYHYTNSTVSGPAEAAVGDTVTVSAVPDVDYGITDQSSQIAVTCNDEPVAFTWDATNQRITFTMPDPT